MLIAFYFIALKLGLWTSTHFWGIIPPFLIFAGIAVLLGFLLRKKDDIIKKQILRAIAVTILVLEVCKQIMSLSDGSYDLYHLPLHYCSLFLYTVPLHAFSFGKFKKFADGFCFMTCASLFLFYMIVPTVLYPTGAITGYFRGFFNFHTVTFHHLVVFYLFLGIAFKQFKISVKRDFPFAAIVLSVYVLIATACSYAHNENYQNLLKCNLEMLENVRLAIVNAIGWVGQVFYISILFIFTTLFSFLAYFLVSLFYKKAILRKNKEKAQKIPTLTFSQEL